MARRHPRAQSAGGFSLLERRILYFIATIGRTGSGITNSDTDNWW
jgi:hypothetical protein